MNPEEYCMRNHEHGTGKCWPEPPVAQCKCHRFGECGASANASGYCDGCEKGCGK